MNLTALICGNRFGRNLVVPGGTGFDLSQEQIEVISIKIDQLEKETDEAISLLWNNQSVLSRFEEIGTVTGETAFELGLVGLCARASGLEQDIRTTMPTGSYKSLAIPISTYDTGDVFARAYVRGLEIKSAIVYIKTQLVHLPQTGIKKPLPELLADQLVVTLNEGWRGEICHVAITNSKGQFERYKIVDPSFHNWIGLSLALRGQGISDFPICNKSFNLSYCGHDL